jgi:hypothetical protein
MAFKNLKGAIDKAVAEGADQTVAKEGGGEQNLAPEGMCNLRIVGYIELGKHEKTFQGKKKTPELVTLIFEASGKNHKPVDTDDGPRPYLIEVTEAYSLNPKARFFKLFQLLNHRGTAKHAAELALEMATYRGRIIHREYEINGQKRKAVELYDKDTGAWTIAPARVDVVDEDGQPTGEQKDIKVAPAISQQRIFLWNGADMEQWQSLFIEGEYPERKDAQGKVTAPAKSKNKYQLKIASALNYKGSPIATLLANNGQELDLPAASTMDDDTPGDDDADVGTNTTQPQTKAMPAAKTTVKSKQADPLAGIETE